MKLTARQAEVYQFICQFIDAHSVPPTRAEIAEGLGFRSVNAAVDHLKVLEKKGAILLQKGTSRGIRLLNRESSAANVLPVIGKVAAGQPLLALENREADYPLPGDMFKPPADYLLRVQGSSMKNIGILDGDLLAVHKTSEVLNGQIAVVRIDDEVTVKRFMRDAKIDYRVTLLAENDDFLPIQVDLRKQTVVVEGLAVGLLRDNQDYFKL